MDVENIVMSEMRVMDSVRVCACAEQCVSSVRYFL